MNRDSLPRGATWPRTIPITRLGVAIPITGFHILVTLRKILIDGTVDSLSPPVWQADNGILGGVTLDANQFPGSPTLGFCYSVMPSTITLEQPNPVAGGIPYYWDVWANDGNGSLGRWQTEIGTLLLTSAVGLTPA